MKRVICFLFAAWVVLGCAATIPKGTFTETGNKNILALSGCRLLIDKRFVKIGEIEKALDQADIDRMVGGSVSASYLFADITEGKDKIRRAVVAIETHLTSHTSIYIHEANFDRYTARHVEKGMTERVGTRCAYLVHEIGAISKPILDFMKANGYAIDASVKKGVEVAFAKTTGKSSRINFYYIEAGDESQAKAVFENAANFIRFEM
jgi:hypothetical protein